MEQKIKEAVKEMLKGISTPGLEDYNIETFTKYIMDLFTEESKSYLMEPDNCEACRTRFISIKEHQAELREKLS